MEQSFLDPYLVYCDELRSEDFKTSSVAIFQGDQIPNTFSLNTISSLLEGEKYPWLFIAKEVLKLNFYIAIGFEENSDIPVYVTNILCTFIRNKIFISNIYKCSKSSSKLLKICRKHLDTIQLDLPSQEQNNEADEILSIVEEKDDQSSYLPDDIEKSISTTESAEQQIQSQFLNEEENENDKKEIEAQSISPKSSITPTKPLLTKWTEKLPQFKWETPLKEYSISKTEIEASLGLFDDVILAEDISPLRSFQNIAHEKLMFAPHSSEKFINRIINHESMFDMTESQDS